MDVKALVDRLVASKKYKDSDREWLTALGEGPLTTISASCGCTASSGGDGGDPPPADPPPAEPPKPADPPPATPPAEPSSASAPKPMTREEWLAAASPEDREIHAQMRADYDADVARFTSEIVTASKGKLTADVLKGKSRAELKAFHEAFVKPDPDFSGQGLRAQDGSTPREKPTHSPMPGLAIKSNKAA